MNELIEQANREWDELHPDEEEGEERLLPLIRLRVSCLPSPDSLFSLSLSSNDSSTDLELLLFLLSRSITLVDLMVVLISKLETLKGLVKIS